MKFSSMFALLLIFSSLTFCKDMSQASIDDDGNGKGKKKEKKKKDKQTASSDITVVNKWELPDQLKEVSGIAYLGENRFACVQDEKGTIYIYNGASKAIEKEIPFRGPGDYESIAVNGNTAYVATADGELFEVNMATGTNGVKKYQTGLTASHDVEGLCLDKKNNRLLLATKNNDPGNKDFKGIYAFNLASKSFESEPVYKIAMKDERLTSGENKKDDVMPSEIAIHPLTGEIYVTDGPNARLLILNAGGEISRLLYLGKAFAQPEGITFSPDGKIFISNEGNKEPGNIIQVSMN